MPPNNLAGARSVRTTLWRDRSQSKMFSTFFENKIGKITATKNEVLPKVLNFVLGARWSNQPFSKS